jgi:hypothetical protein
LNPANPPCLRDNDEYNNVCCEECAKFRIKVINCHSSKGCKQEIFSTKTGLNPCFNGGVCGGIPGDKKDFVCNCPKGFKGSLCMQKSGCDSNPCNNGGECIRLGDGGEFYCKCDNAEFANSKTCGSNDKNSTFGSNDKNSTLGSNDRNSTLYSTFYSVFFSIMKDKSFGNYILVTIILVVSITIIVFVIICSKKLKKKFNKKKNLKRKRNIVNQQRKTIKRK